VVQPEAEKRMDFLVRYDRPNIYYGLRGFETGARIGGASDTAKGA